MDSSTLLRIENLKKYFNVRSKGMGRTILRAVDGVSFAIRRGETFGIVGESGCGKTTLGRTILRLIEPDSGTIVYDGDDVTRGNMRPYRSRMQIIFQNPVGSLDPRNRVSDIVAEGLRVKYPSLKSSQRLDRVKSLLESVGLDQGCAYRYPHEFSGGQQQRIGIARALAVEPDFIVCDEPVTALDVSYQSQILNLLVELQRKLGLTYLFISHDLSVVRHLSDRIGVMYLGKLVEVGSCQDVVLSPAHQYTRALLEAIPIPDPNISRTRDRKLLDEFADLSIPDKGCRYSRLCEYSTPVCLDVEPELEEISPGHLCACHSKAICGPQVNSG
jgi:oligopeptide transport system ATP-binding protein